MTYDFLRNYAAWCRAANEPDDVTQAVRQLFEPVVKKEAEKAVLFVETSQPKEKVL